jgi:hypothetical protein
MQLALQRMLPDHDSKRWRTVHHFSQEECLEVLPAAAQMSKVGSELLWRVVIDDDFQRPILYWTPRSGWVEPEKVDLPTRRLLAS